MKVQLRDYQDQTILEAKKILRLGKKRVLIYSPTGSGKGELAVALAQMAAEKGKKVLFLVHRKDLVRQQWERFAKYKIYPGILQGQNTHRPHSEITVASIQTFSSRKKFGWVFDFDLVIIDEAHLCGGSAQYHEFMRTHNNMTVLGLTATPFSKGLGREYPWGKVFEDMVVVSTIQDLIDRGFLVDCEMYAPSEPDLKGVKIVAGDYHQKQLGAAVDKQELIGDIVEHWFKLANGLQTICFATNIDHSRHIVEQFQRKGVSAEHLDCYCKEDQRNEVIDRFRAGKIQVLSNVSLFAEGFDAPETACMILARPTRSLIRYIQMVGRVLRPAKGKTCLSRGTKILTDKGEVSIEQITLDHKVWDGCNFVEHKGAVCMGIKKVISYDGIVATPDHEVMTYDGWKRLEEAKGTGRRIVVTGISGKPIRLSDDHLYKYHREDVQSIGSCEMRGLRKRVNEPFSQYGKKTEHKSLSTLQSEEADNCSRMALCKNSKSKRTLRKSIKQKLQKLWSSWNPIQIQWSKRSGNLDYGKSRNTKRSRGLSVRQNRQQWTLRAWESALGYGIAKSSKFAEIQRSYTAIREIPTGTQGSEIRRQHTISVDINRTFIRSDCGEMECEILQTEGEVWDILDAGPLQRFTANGRLVHNCALVLDHSGSVARLGFPTDPLPLELDDGKAAESKNTVKTEPTTKVCPKCKHVTRSRPKVCKKCGYEFAFQTPKPEGIQHQEGSLQKIVKMPQEAKQKIYSGLVAYAIKKGYQSGWVSHKYRRITGVWPKGLDYVAGPIPDFVQKIIVSEQIKYSKRRA